MIIVLGLLVIVVRTIRRRGEESEEGHKMQKIERELKGKPASCAFSVPSAPSNPSLRLHRFGSHPGETISVERESSWDHILGESSSPTSCRGSLAAASAILSPCIPHLDFILGQCEELSAVISSSPFASELVSDFFLEALPLFKLFPLFFFFADLSSLFVER